MKVEVSILNNNWKYKIQIEQKIENSHNQRCLVSQVMYHQQKNQSPNRTTFMNQEVSVLPNSHEDDSLSCLKDTIISLDFRVKTLEAQLNGKMERQQCLTLLQRKSNSSYVKKGFEQIYSKIQADRLKEESNFQKMEQQQKQKINQLKKKLKQVNNTRQGTQLGSPLAKDISSFNFTQNMSKKLNKTLVKPQELYLESNQTMFSMLIDQIKELKQRDSLIQRLIQSKHKKTISLNNEVCRKLQHLQCQLQQTIKYIDTLQYKPVNTYSSQVSKKPNKKSTSKSQKQQIFIEKFDKNTPQNQAFEMIRLQLLSKSMEGIQKELSQKLNIRDVIPLIKQNVPGFEESIQQIKNYVEDNFESMRKILQNQSDINEQISRSNRVAWWHCYQKCDFGQSERSETDRNPGYILFSKQIMNIIPQNLIVEKDEQHTLKILTKGWYLIHVYELGIGNQSEESRNELKQTQVWIEVNSGTKHPILDKKLFNLAAGSELRVITSRDDLFFQVQKL